MQCGGEVCRQSSARIKAITSAKSARRSGALIPLASFISSKQGRFA
jgi:hypothetical protein